MKRPGEYGYTKSDTVTCIQTYGTSSIKAKRSGDIVTLMIGGLHDAINNWVNITTTLPEEYRPQEAINTYSITADGNKVMYSINTNGTIEVKKEVGTSYLTITYIV